MITPVQLGEEVVTAFHCGKQMEAKWYTTRKATASPFLSAMVQFSQWFLRGKLGRSHYPILQMGKLNVPSEGKRFTQGHTTNLCSDSKAVSVICLFVHSSDLGVGLEGSQMEGFEMCGQEEDLLL